MPWLRQKMIKSIPCLRQKSRKLCPGWPHVPIKGSTPPPPTPRSPANGTELEQAVRTHQTESCRRGSGELDPSLRSSISTPVSVEVVKGSPVFPLEIFQACPTYEFSEGITSSTLFTTISVPHHLEFWWREHKRMELVSIWTRSSLDGPFHGSFRKFLVNGKRPRSFS